MALGWRRQQLTLTQPGCRGRTADCGRVCLHDDGPLDQVMTVLTDRPGLRARSASPCWWVTTPPSSSPTSTLPPRSRHARRVLRDGPRHRQPGVIPGCCVDAHWSLLSACSQSGNTRRPLSERSCSSPRQAWCESVTATVLRLSCSQITETSSWPSFEVSLRPAAWVRMWRAAGQRQAFTWRGNQPQTFP